jgi:hypothetical protein
MLAWTLFGIHKVLMLLIGYSTIRVVFGYARLWHVLLASGFLITQGVFGKCFVTGIENMVRESSGYATTSNQFILHNLLPQGHWIFARVVFVIVGVMLTVLWADRSLTQHQTANLILKGE